MKIEVSFQTDTRLKETSTLTMETIKEAAPVTVVPPLIKDLNSAMNSL